MKTWTLQAEVALDGMLHLAVPSGLPPGAVEVVVVVQPQGQNGAAVKTATSVEAVTPQSADLTVSSVSDIVVDPDRRARFARRLELMDMALAGVEWAEIEEGRRDRGHWS